MSNNQSSKSSSGFPLLSIVFLLIFGYIHFAPIAAEYGNPFLMYDSVLWLISDVVLIYLAASLASFVAALAAVTGIVVVLFPFMLIVKLFSRKDNYSGYTRSTRKRSTNGFGRGIRYDDYWS